MNTRMAICVNLYAFYAIPLSLLKKSIFGHFINAVDALGGIQPSILTVQVAIPIFEPECILCTYMHLYAIFKIVVS